LALDSCGLLIAAADASEFLIDLERAVGERLAPEVRSSYLTIAGLAVEDNLTVDEHKELVDSLVNIALRCPRQGTPPTAASLT
jgi:hypothetical protein